MSKRLSYVLFILVVLVIWVIVKGWEVRFPWWL